MPMKIAQPIFFGPFPVTSQIFHLTAHSFAFVNLKPIRPGHVLVSPRRCVPRLRDLTSAEATDFMLAMQRVARMVERVYASDAVSLSIQDGPAAGQSVAHVHAHVLPRHWGDLTTAGVIDGVKAAEPGQRMRYDPDVAARLVAKLQSKQKKETEEEEQEVQEIHALMEGEAGDVGGHLYLSVVHEYLQSLGQGGGARERIVMDPAFRPGRSMQEMESEADLFAREMEIEMAAEDKGNSNNNNRSTLKPN